MNQESLSILLAKILSKEASQEQIHDFQRLISENQEWKSIFHNLEELWNSKSENSNISDTEEAYMLLLGRLKSQVDDFEEDQELVPQLNEDFQLYPINKKWNKKWVFYASIFVLVITSIFSFSFFYNYKSPGSGKLTHFNEIKVNPGVKTKVQLPDGSHVWVNSDSKLSYSETFNGPLREVFLEGEAYFDVVKDADHPFIVHTSGIDIKVLGTAFNVKAYKAEPTIEATLIHGMIEVAKLNQPNAPKLILKPHEKLIYDKFASEESIIKAQPSVRNAALLSRDLKPAIIITPLTKNLADSAITETSWVYNRLSFDEQKFDDLALTMERWFNVKITINTDNIKNNRLTGTFENETIEEALKELQYLVSFSYQINGREVIINKK